MNKKDIPNLASIIDKELRAFFYDYNKVGDLKAFHLVFEGEAITITLDGDSFKIDKYSS